MSGKLANPFGGIQAPDAKALGKSTTLVVPTQPLATPAIAQEYFEPGVNTKLNRRTRPKTNYELPSDMPKYELGFVPTNKTPGAAGEEPAIVPQKVSAPQDLLEVFAKINAEEKAEQMLPKGPIDTGGMTSRVYRRAMREAEGEKKREMMVREGFTAAETEAAMSAIRMEEAVKMAKAPTIGMTVEEAIKERFALEDPKAI